MMAATRTGPAGRLSTTFRAGTPQLYLDVDRVKAKTMGVPLSDVFDTLQIYLGSLYVNDLNLFGRTYHVTAQADAPFRRQPSDIPALKTRNSAGQMVPLGPWSPSATSSAPTASPNTTCTRPRKSTAIPRARRQFRGRHRANGRNGARHAAAGHGL